MIDAYWLALQRIPGVGNRLYRELIDVFGDAGSVFAARRGQLTKIAGITPPVLDALARGPQEGVLASDAAWLEADGNTALSIFDEQYPALLREIPDAPSLLLVRGRVSTLSRPQIAIVGSRNPTPGGLETARAFARHLSRSGLIVTSGLAEGIDGAAHLGALDAGSPTVAVFGTGVDRVYPAQHRELAHRIAEHGTLVSEFPLGTGAARDHFPRRNRILSGLSLATLVIEASLRSGSLITARLAAEQGREVMAIPGSIHSPLARGCHRLIRQGAKLVEAVEDILEELAPLAEFALRSIIEEGPQRAHQVDEETRKFLDHVGFVPISVDTLVERTGLTAAAVSSMLLRMELDGLVAQSPGGRYVCVRTDHRSKAK